MKWCSRPRLLLVAVALTGVALLAAAGLHGTLVYYHDPSEIAERSDLLGQRIRVCGWVVPGSLRHTSTQVEFAITDKRHQVDVVHRGPGPRQLSEGQQAVVEGTLGQDKVFHSDQIIVRHSNEYQPARTR